MGRFYAYSDVEYPAKQPANFSEILREIRVNLHRISLRFSLKTPVKHAANSLIFAADFTSKNTLFCIDICILRVILTVFEV